MKKILYAAGTIGHINNFHLPYIKKLRSEGHEVTVMARGKGADIDMPFEKKMLSPKNLLCAFKIRGILKRGKFDTVILNTTLAAFDVRFLMPRHKRPKVINFVHGYMFSPKPKELTAASLVLPSSAPTMVTFFLPAREGSLKSPAVRTTVALS